MRGESCFPAKATPGTIAKTTLLSRQLVTQNVLREARRPIMAGAPMRSTPTRYGAAKIKPMPKPMRGT